MSLPKVPSQELTTFKDLATLNGYNVVSGKTVEDVMKWKIFVRFTTKSVAVLTYNIRTMMWNLDVHSPSDAIATELHRMLKESKQEISYGG